MFKLGPVWSLFYVQVLLLEDQVVAAGENTSAVAWEGASPKLEGLSLAR